jgi:formate dehydrogenase subunit gamma
MIGTPGLATPMDSRKVTRFNPTERALHMIHGLFFLVMLFSGMVLYWPPLATLFNRRPLIKEVHLLAAIGWLIAIIILFILGDRKSLKKSWAEIETIDKEDRAWLRGKGSAGRFNAGQKLNTIFSVAAILLFFLSGVLLWLGEKNTTFRFQGTVVVHDALFWVSLIALMGHVYLAAFNQSTRHSMKGIATGKVEEEWAKKHHPRWEPED